MLKRRAVTAVNNKILSLLVVTLSEDANFRNIYCPTKNTSRNPPSRNTVDFIIDCWSVYTTARLLYLIAREFHTKISSHTRSSLTPSRATLAIVPIYGYIPLHILRQALKIYALSGAEPAHHDWHMSGFKLRTWPAVRYRDRISVHRLAWLWSFQKKSQIYSWPISKLLKYPSGIVLGSSSRRFLKNYELCT